MDLDIDIDFHVVLTDRISANRSARSACFVASSRSDLDLRDDRHDRMPKISESPAATQAGTLPHCTTRTRGRPSGAMACSRPGASGLSSRPSPTVGAAAAGRDVLRQGREFQRPSYATAG
jgi:hypothetical protein